MTDPDLYPPAFRPIRQRIRAVVALVLEGERARAAQEGIPSTVFAEGTLNTFLGLVARSACAVVCPDANLDSVEGRARVARVQRAVAQALVTIMAQEKQRGHA